MDRGRHEETGHRSRQKADHAWREDREKVLDSSSKGHKSNRERKHRRDNTSRSHSRSRSRSRSRSPRSRTRRDVSPGGSSDDDRRRRKKSEKRRRSSPSRSSSDFECSRRQDPKLSRHSGFDSERMRAAHSGARDASSRADARPEKETKFGGGGRKYKPKAGRKKPSDDQTKAPKVPKPKVLIAAFTLRICERNEKGKLEKIGRSEGMELQVSRIGSLPPFPSLTPALLSRSHQVGFPETEAAAHGRG